MVKKHSNDEIPIGVEGFPTPCLYCKYMGDPNNAGRYTCQAFPEGIPDEVTRPPYHRKPLAGDHGLQFTPEAGALESKWARVDIKRFSL